jgi:hypothetical protein
MRTVTHIQTDLRWFYKGYILEGSDTFKVNRIKVPMIQRKEKMIFYSHGCWHEMPSPPTPLVSEQRRFLHVFGGSSTSDNLNKFASNDGLSGTVVQNLVLANHLTSVLGGILYMRGAGESAIVHKDTKGKLGRR